MKIGHIYKIVPTEKKCKHCGTEFEPQKRTFPFGENVGMFLGVEPSGFLTFRLSGTRWASMNGGSYEEIKNIPIHFVGAFKELQ